jgi:hypothetical protein
MQLHASIYPHAYQVLGFFLEVTMKTRINTVAAVVMALFCLIVAPQALSADRNIIGELTVLPYSVSVDRNISKELSTPRYVVTRDQKMMQSVAVLASFAIIDYTQSVSMFYGSEGYQEMNPLLGSKPSRGSMAAFGIIGVGIFYLVSDYLSEPWRQIFADSIIASERMNIEDNRRLYQGWNTDGPPIRGRSFNGIPIVISFRL